ncbi:unnamed protein product, partial [Thlaspi arvense]
FKWQTSDSAFCHKNLQNLKTYLIELLLLSITFSRSLKKRGQGLRAWIRVDTSGNSQVLEVDKFTIMRRCDLPARDLRLLDPLFVYPSTILGREKAIVVNLEQIRCIITADELQRRLRTAGVGEDWKAEGIDFNRRTATRNFDNMFASTSPDYLPFEFRALEVALEAACTFLDSQVLWILDLMNFDSLHPAKWKPWEVGIGNHQ